MKKIISLVCALVLLALCVAPMPAKAAANDTNDTLQMSAVFLRTAEGKEGIFFGAQFTLSQNTLDNMSCYGLALTTKNLDGDDTWTTEMDNSVLRSRYETGLKPGVRKEVTSTSLVNIINISNDSMTNNRNANTVIYVRPYVELDGETFMYGDAASITMKQVAQMVDKEYHNKKYVDNTQKQGLLGMYERFSSCMKGWGLTNLKTHYNNGGYVTVTDENGQEQQVSLILQYRRDKVVADMTAQNNVLWSFDGEETIQYSRRPTSNGLEVDSTKYPDDVYTLYPKRVYRGIPYTHGSSGLDAFQHLAGDPDASGVYNFDNFNGSYFNGGSTAGSSTTTGLYNMSRLGNDCWDAVYWAWASAGANTTADQTQQMTPSYGLKYLGQEFLEEAMAGKKISTVRYSLSKTSYDVSPEDMPDELINNFTNAELYLNLTGNLVDDITTSGNYTGLTNKTYALGDGTYTIGAIDGTKIVTYATRTGSSSNYSYPAMYKTYAMMQPGDAMVHWSNGSGHSIMVIDTNIVFTNKVLNADGTVNLAESTIDGDASTIILLEQASGHEFRQSKETSAFTITSLADHNSHKDGSSEECLYCAGYTGEKTADGREIWKLDYGLQVRSFKTMAESDYLAVTHEVLTDPAAKISASRISDSGSDVDVSGIYTGTLSSTYRVAYITLDIFDNAGTNKGSASCFSTQATVRDPFSLGLFPIDGGNKPAYGNVLKGNLVLEQKTDGTNTWLEAPSLDAGSYSYALTCVLANGYTKTFRSGYFTVSEGTNPVGKTANMVYAD